jgi:hypothetical protein
VLCHLSHASNPFCFQNFLDRVLSFYPGQPGTKILLPVTSTTQEAGIRGRHHCSWLLPPFCFSINAHYSCLCWPAQLLMPPFNFLEWFPSRMLLSPYSMALSHDYWPLNRPWWTQCESCQCVKQWKRLWKCKGKIHRYCWETPTCVLFKLKESYSSSTLWNKQVTWQLHSLKQLGFHKSSECQLEGKKERRVMGQVCVAVFPFKQAFHHAFFMKGHLAQAPLRTT